MNSPLQHKVYRYSASQAGFSLIEVLVSLAIFAIVVTMSVGTMVVMIDANSKAQFTQTIVSNAAFALDSMTRDIRTGTNYVCTSISATASENAWNNVLELDEDDASPVDCTNGDTALAFSETGGSLTGGLASNRIAFRYAVVDGIGQIQRKLSTNGGDWQVITAENVNITELTFVTRNTDTTDAMAPTVVIYIQGEGVGDMQNTEFNLQTTITQRALDL